MKLAIVSELYLPSCGGQEFRYSQLAAELISRGHEVVIYAIGHEKGLPAQEEISGLKIRRILDAPHYIDRGGGLSRDPRVIFQFALALLRRIKELRQYDSVIFNIWPVLPPIVCGPFLGDKALVDWCELRSGKAWQLIYRLLTLTSRKHIAVNESILDRLINDFGVPAANTLPVLSGIHTAKYSPKDEQKREYILFFGRLSPHKNPLLLAESYLSSPAVQALAPLVFAGGGEAKEELQALNHPRIKVLGFVSDDQKFDLLRRAKLLVLPSRREGFPRVIAEAAAAGTPVLTTEFPDNGSVSIVRQYGLGRVCPPDAASLAQAMETCLTDNEEWTQVSKQAMDAAAREFDWDVVTNSLLRFLRQAEFQKNDESLAVSLEPES